MTAPKGNKPDYKIHVLNKNTRAQAKVGAAWLKPDGSLSIQFDDFIDLNLLKGPSIIVTMFPEAGKAKRFINKP